MIRFKHLLMAFLIRHACQSQNEGLTHVFKLRSARSATARPKDKTVLLILSLIFFGLLIFLTIICLYRKCRRKNVNQNNRQSLTVRYTALPQRFLVNTSLNSEESNKDLLERLNLLRITYNDYKKKYEIHTSNLKFSNEKLGEGQYGCVNLGYLQKGDEKLKVAVKKSKKPTDPYESRMFMAELTVMCAIEKHPNVLALIGGVTKTKCKRIVMEFVDGGNLRGFLRKYKENITDGCGEISTFNLISFAFQIANGMEHLAKIPVNYLKKKFRIERKLLVRSS
ncbi:hypothetical protein CAEBREN_13799 [Caenorhabditis brenneri]|uniref:Protein kinase domain-containing protein n=1 Tax=Caenorhabditis brenneri TaxID=135651 RepID=G0PMJ4_CAEBE|nr:hypothetical protein CAEBREN_13799 [Caenorhabditis brenneri]